MSGAYSPAAMRSCYDKVKAAIPSAQLSGIYANKPGYHNCRAQLPSSDYSVQKSYDQKGDAWAAAGLDITLGDADMKKLTQRLIDETQRNADRGLLYGVREFFGTTNGTTVTGMDVPGQYWVTSDSSHLWHVHISGKRQYTNDQKAWDNVAAVLLGTGGTTPTEDDMPKQIYLYSKSGQVTNLPVAGTWYCVGWDSALANTGGSSLSLPKGASLFSMSAWLSCEGVPLDDNIYWRIQTLDGAKNNAEMAKFPIAEQRGTTGGTSFNCSQVGSVQTNTQVNLRVLVACTKANAKITSAWWRCLYW